MVTNFVDYKGLTIKSCNGVSVGSRRGFLQMQIKYLCKIGISLVQCNGSQRSLHLEYLFSIIEFTKLYLALLIRPFSIFLSQGSVLTGGHGLMVNGYYPVIQALAHALDSWLNQRCVDFTQHKLLDYLIDFELHKHLKLHFI
jgi:hypothetical protein